MGLVHDHRKAAPTLTRDRLQVLGGELLDRRHDDPRALGDGILELTRGAVDLLHHPLRLLELRHGALQLPVQHHPVGDDDGGIEHRLVVGVVQLDRMMRQPADGVGLARARRMLHQIVVAGAMLSRMRNRPAHRVELLEAREDHLLPLTRRFQVHELADHVQQHAREKIASPQSPARYR